MGFNTSEVMDAPDVAIPIAMLLFLLNHIVTTSIVKLKIRPVPSPINMPCVRIRCHTSVKKEAAMYPNPNNATPRNIVFLIPINDASGPENSVNVNEHEIASVPIHEIYTILSCANISEMYLL
ncbi:hypothetical protein AX774_g6367 [Zancudomyces culisetae]|uniref:Uncharacterized protein n=1 Tax=Zancudomyces culisetae TaxID=1213189 RepID=A0A1R1PH06_ZANCU|nr:hypothetical protein AX774_g6367 [Zancudomyces culisetae]|eukprot:OMH80209.1 hypothetical protein AX774_g6367 [Zancudomyces culisetae]